MQKSKHMTLALLCGMLGCLCFGGDDWLMIYGDTHPFRQPVLAHRGRQADRPMA